MDEETLKPLTSEEGNNGDQPMADLPDQDLSSSDSDSDSDSGSEDGDDQAHHNLQLQTLEAELSANPGNYDTHVQYIKILRQMAKIEKLRQAREAMNQLFPLTPSMWQDWAKDEASLSTGSDAFWAIEKLYERGVFEYLSISLWCDYLDFVKENDPSVRECSPAGISKARDLFERALTAAGLHVSEGNKLWEAYRSFEQAIFHTIDEKDNQAREKQIQRVRSLFHRQLSVPHVNMRSTLLDYKAWEVEQGNILDAGSSDLDGISFQVASAYKKALEMYDARIHLEEQICLQDMSESERLQNFMNYLRFEQSSGDPARVQTLYERAITAFPISSYLWLDYTRYLDKTLKVGNVITNVYSRAVMNCPCVGELWVQYMLSLERGHVSEKEIASVFEKSLLCTLTLDEYLDLYLTRVDGLRRRISCAVEREHGLEYSLIRETFQMSRLITRRRSVTNAPPALSPSTAPAVSAPLIGEPTPFIEATATTSQVPLSSTSSVSVQFLNARRPHRRRRDSESSIHSSSSSRVEDGGSPPAKKNTRGPNRMLKAAQMVRLSASLIKIAYDSRHRGAATSQQHSIVVTSCGYVIKNCCPMQWKSWAEIPEETKILVRDKLSVNFDFKDISPEVITYLDETFANRYKNWKSDLHAHFKIWGDVETARLQGCPSELADRREDWEWLCNHFTDPKFVKKSIAGKIARESKTLLHHSGSKPFSYRLEARREEGSKFPEIDVFNDVYVQPGDETSEQLYASMVEKRDVVLQEATSQLPPDTPIEDVTVSDDAGFEIMTEVLNQKFGRRHGKVVRGMGKARVRETGASSSRSTTGEVNALKEEVTTLKGQLVAQNEQMKVQNEQLRAENEQMKAQVRTHDDKMNMILQALAISGLQIQMPSPDLVPPSTSQPFHPTDT